MREYIDPAVAAFLNGEICVKSISSVKEEGGEGGTLRSVACSVQNNLHARKLL